MQDGSDTESVRRFERIAEHLAAGGPLHRSGPHPGFFPLVRRARTRDAIQLDFTREDDGVVVLLTPEAMEVRLPETDWVGHRPVSSSRLWKRLRLDKLPFDLEEWYRSEGLAALLGGALAARARDIRTCRFCRERVMVEHTTDGACHGCASRELGVVY